MKLEPRNTTIIAVALLLAAGGTQSKAQTGQANAELRSSAALLASGAIAPTAPAALVADGTQAWVCDAAKGLQPAVPTEQNVLDPVMAIGTTGIKLPISATTVPASCGQAAISNGTVYVTQAIVDTAQTPSSARGVLRTAVDVTGALLGPSVYIASTAGLDGNQPTAAAIGPDGNLYIGFLKNGNVKRIVNPGSGTSQVVQSVGNTPSGHAARAFAFVGADLYIASLDALSVIRNATSTACTGGCNATTITDGFAGVVHTGVTSDGIGMVYFSVAQTGIPGGSQVWRFDTNTQLFSFVAQGGADRSGANASNFSFVAAKTNLLTLDATGTLWIGDDPSNGTVAGNGRLWTVSPAALAALPSGSFTAGTGLSTILSVLKGPWFLGFETLGFTPTFAADGTFTAVIAPTAGGVATAIGTWTLSPPNTLQPFSNAQGHLTFVDSTGALLFSSDILLLNLDMIDAEQPWTGSLGVPISGVYVKETP